MHAIIVEHTFIKAQNLSQLVARCRSYRRVADRFPRRHRADVGCLMHERVESARPLQPPLRSGTRHLRYDRQEANT